MKFFQIVSCVGGRSYDMVSLSQTQTNSPVTIMMVTRCSRLGIREGKELRLLFVIVRTAQNHAGTSWADDGGLMPVTLVSAQLDSIKLGKVPIVRRTIGREYI